MDNTGAEHSKAYLIFLSSACAEYALHRQLHTNLRHPVLQQRLKMQANSTESRLVRMKRHTLTTPRDVTSNGFTLTSTAQNTLTISLVDLASNLAATQLGLDGQRYLEANMKAYVTLDPKTQQYRRHTALNSSGRSGSRQLQSTILS